MTPATTARLLASYLHNAANARADPAHQGSATDQWRQADSARQSWEAAAVLAAGDGDAIPVPHPAKCLPRRSTSGGRAGVTPNNPL